MHMMRWSPKGLLFVWLILLAPPAIAEQPTPFDVLNTCTNEIGECWQSHGLDLDNLTEVFDACWREVKKCPQVCKDEYFTRRKDGMDVDAADPLFFGVDGEAKSCVPGVDELTHPNNQATTAQPQEKEG